MSLELEVAREIQAMQFLDHDILSQALRKLPTPAKFASHEDIPENYHLCSKQELLDAFLGVFERFSTEEDFDLWGTVAYAIELFEESRILEGLFASFLRQPMWKTAELAVQYCIRNQIEELLAHHKELGGRSVGDDTLDFEYIIKILEEGLD